MSDSTNPCSNRCLDNAQSLVGPTNNTSHTVVIFGASGDLSKKKIYPNLWTLFRDQLLPNNLRIWGYARSQITVTDIKSMCLPFMKVKPEEDTQFQNFWALNTYIKGNYDSKNDMNNLNRALLQFETEATANRLLYLALPPSIFEDVTLMINRTCMSKKGWTRIVIEKPFGHDSMSSQKLTDHLALLFKENEIYRIDHYLGKEMVQNLMTLRFGNRIFGPAWNRDHVAAVKITFKENMGTASRAGYFNEYGILRDVMQNHLLQILTLVAMEKPATCQPDDIRDEKVKVLKHIAPLDLDDVVLGQFIADPSGEGESLVGYLDEPGVPEDSITPTFATAILRINNERWEGVPFILKCGKGLDEQKAEVRIQFDDVLGDIYDGRTKRNELVLRVQPGEAIYIKLMVKTPGHAFSMQETELDLTFSRTFANTHAVEAYEKLILDVFSGSQMHFVRSDELVQAWRIFTPLLQKIKLENVKPIPYKFGCRGPEEADELIKRNNYIYTGSYSWRKPSRLKYL